MAIIAIIRRTTIDAITPTISKCSVTNFPTRSKKEAKDQRRIRLTILGNSSFDLDFFARIIFVDHQEFSHIDIVHRFLDDENFFLELFVENFDVFFVFAFDHISSFDLSGSLYSDRKVLIILDDLSLPLFLKIIIRKKITTINIFLSTKICGYLVWR